MEPICSNIKKIQKTENPKKKFLIFQEAEILKKRLIFWETESFSPPRENFLYFKKRNFVIFRERYIWNLSIFRTLLYSKPETYSEHCQESTMESFAKNSYIAHFSASAPKTFS